MIKSVCIFCGSSSTQRKGTLFKKEHANIAKNVGKKLALKKIKIIYGGANVGLMGIMADEALKNNYKFIFWFFFLFFSFIIIIDGARKG